MRPMHAERSPDSSVTQRGQGPQLVANQSIQDRTGLIVAILALATAMLAMGAVGMMYAMTPTLIDAKVQAGVAKSEVMANQARVDARVTLDKIEELRVKQAGEKR